MQTDFLCGIHLADGQSVTLLNDHEVACALILLAIQDAITANGLAVRRGT